MHKVYEHTYPLVPARIHWGAAIRQVWELLRNYRGSLVALTVLGAAIALTEGLSVGLIVPFLESFGGQAASASLRQSPVGFLSKYFEALGLADRLRAIALALVGIQLLRSGFLYIHAWLTRKLQVRLDRELRLTVFDQLLKVSLGFIHKERIANLFTLLNDFAPNSAGLATSAVGAGAAVARLIVYLAMLVAVSWKLTLLSTALTLLTSVLMGGMNQRLRNLGAEANQAAVRLNHSGFEALSGMRLFRLFAHEEVARKRFDESVRVFMNRSYAKGLFSALTTPLYSILNALVLAVILGGSTFVLMDDGQSWVAVLTVFILIFYRVSEPASALIAIRAEIAGNLPALESTMAFLSRRDMPFLREGSRLFEGIRNEIRFENVSFRYADAEGEVLRGVSMTIEKGKTTAIVGSSGSGKTTLINLLARLYDPSEGCIRVDGLDLREYKSRSWRGRLGVVTQDVFLFNDTIRSNILFGRDSVGQAEIESTARQAFAHDFIGQMVEGYDTMVGDRGIRLSGGQAQRVALARALLCTPEILILDEATSSLDSVSERQVQTAIDAVSRGRTVVVVAHRLSTVRRVDKIIVLEGGRIIESGTHDDLMARNGKYAQYVRMQELDAGA